QLQVGTLSFTNDGSTFGWTPDPAHVTFSSLVVARTIDLGGALTVPQDMTLAGGTFTVNGHSVSVGGAFTASGGTLVMLNGNDLVDIQGTISWTGASTNLQAGTLRGHGRFAVQNNSGFSAVGGSNTVELVGTVATIHLDNAQTNGNHFRNLTV